MPNRTTRDPYGGRTEFTFDGMGFFRLEKTDRSRLKGMHFCLWASTTLSRD